VTSSFLWFAAVCSSGYNFCVDVVFFGSALESILSSVKHQNFGNRGIEDKFNLSEDRGQISKIEDSPLKNQADGQPRDNYYIPNSRHASSVLNKNK